MRCEAQMKTDHCLSGNENKRLCKASRQLPSEDSGEVDIGVHVEAGRVSLNPNVPTKRLHEKVM